MPRRKKGRPISGWLCLDKPVGITSTRAVAIVRRLLDAEKAGHAGTLDPLASGILPIALGEATKTVSFAMDGAKAYRFTILWGVETDTDDGEGEAVATSDHRPDRAAIEAMLSRFTGEIMQVPPAFSAIKVDGERAYKLAREGEAVTLEARPVFIERLVLAESPDADHAIIEAECGKGTYVRALARDLARALGTRGHVEALRRTRVGPFDERRAVSLAALEEAHQAGGPAACEKLLMPVGMPLDGVDEVPMRPADAAQLRRGQPVILRGRDAPLPCETAVATEGGRLVAIGRIAEGAFHPTRVFSAN